MRFFLTYIKRNLFAIAEFFIIGAVFALSFVLFRLPFKAVLYPYILCAAVGAAVFAVNYLRASVEHQSFEELRGLPDELTSKLYSFRTLDDEDYIAVIELLMKREKERETQISKRDADMSDYYTTWVHQIKTPISSMHLTLQNEDIPSARKLSGDLFAIEQYVEMALTYLRLEDGVNDYMFAQHSLDKIIRSSVKKFAGQFIGRGISLNYTKTEKTVLTDEKWLGFVIEQIISNSLKYTPSHGGVAIEVSDSDNPRFDCAVTISDTGIGIAPEDLPRVFEKGYTGFNGRSDKKATGLGLYLCRRVCKELGLGISITSEISSGTAVRLELGGSPSERYE